MFVDHKQMPANFFKKDQLFKIVEKAYISLDKWFVLKFASGNEVTARINEEFMWSTICTNGEIVDSLGQEMCVTIDIALAGSGCEAIVESFYSVVNSQKMANQMMSLFMAQLLIGVSLIQYRLQIL